MNWWHLKQAARIIGKGGIVAYPTEAVYGLGCDPLNGGAVLRLLELKRRSVYKGLILIAATARQLEQYLAPLNEETWAKIKRTWPGPVTWLLPAHPATPWWITGGRDSVAVRVTAHPAAAALCRAAGRALVSTSANVSNHPPASTPLAVRVIFGDRVDLILHGRTGELAKPTEIRDALTGKIVRGQAAEAEDHKG
ncbi:MAG: threonylcarbamoyl-AMP synthase [Gammaproteobacteria bacterium]|nr:threonylcarbamoyl-AMP synthase [Gammaproteobacteria bacterium]NIR98391.1 threonylcarbamoyl-AMP synthase [Gammaproteobacteria bacterium]NIT64145.1 threonylcarbamoyl-AMP synthase [Gammaproteobacteria bacterium]NIV21082.1 threonylcarbamoyl-AMP synthase [Gammaproteobacteria bacterium]NIY32725.1 threonylcarbamoyl-AMP synthase [Gammaproteobacteria bacterium]